MSNNSKKRSYREQRVRDINEKIPERIPKKHRSRNESNSTRQDGVQPEEQLPDPVAEARKALEMFEEISGETMTHIIPKKDIAINKEDERRNDDANCISNETGFTQTSTTRRSRRGSAANVGDKRKPVGSLQSAAASEEESKETEREREKSKEDKAREKKRIEIGEARRREFRPKIAGVQDSNCLL